MRYSFDRGTTLYFYKIVRLNYEHKEKDYSFQDFLAQFDTIRVKEEND